MTQPAKAQEPSMEEILASIRRIIADEEPAKPVAAAEPAPAEPPQPAPAAATDEYGDNARPGDDILELTESMTEPPPAPSFRTIDGQPDVVFTENEEEQSASDFSRAGAPEAAASAGEPSFEKRLLSAGTSAAVDAAFNTLAHTVLVQNGRTLEDLVREMLRPLLKAWLDDNLPSLVERLVRAEIERVSRGRT